MKQKNKNFILVAFPRFYLTYLLATYQVLPRSSNPTVMTPSFVPRHTVCNLFTAQVPALTAN